MVGARASAYALQLWFLYPHTAWLCRVSPLPKRDSAKFARLGTEVHYYRHTSAAEVRRLHHPSHAFASRGKRRGYRILRKERRLSPSTFARPKARLLPNPL